MNRLKTISILGCGWLGLPLAKILLKMGYSIKGSIRQEIAFHQLTQDGIDPFILKLENNSISGDINEFLRNTEILVISIPPKLRINASENFVAKIKILLPYIEFSSVKKVIFISSTSVYGNNHPNLVTEDTMPNPETQSGKQLLEVEQLLQRNTSFQTTVVRFGGLIGDNRNPINFLLQQNEIKNPDAPINLIHLDDCLGIIVQIIKQEKWNEIFNAVAPYHPTKKEYYCALTSEKEHNMPILDEQPFIQGKIISIQKLETTLKYKFIKSYLK